MQGAKQKRLLDMAKIRARYSFENGDEPMSDEALGEAFYAVYGERPTGALLATLRYWEDQERVALDDSRREMTREEICNVVTVRTNELLDALEPFIDASGDTMRIEDLVSHWALGLDPEDCDLDDDDEPVAPFKPLKPADQRFRSSL